MNDCHSSNPVSAGNIIKAHRPWESSSRNNHIVLPFPEQIHTTQPRSSTTSSPLTSPPLNLAALPGPPSFPHALLNPPSPPTPIEPTVDIDQQIYPGPSPRFPYAEALEHTPPLSTSSHSYDGSYPASYAASEAERTGSGPSFRDPHDTGYPSIPSTLSYGNTNMLGERITPGTLNSHENGTSPMHHQQLNNPHYISAYPGLSPYNEVPEMSPHYDQMALSPPPLPPTTTDRRNHQCDMYNPNTGTLCNMKFSRHHDLRRHQTSVHDHDDTHRVRCVHCPDKTFSRSDALARHNRLFHSN